MSWNLNKGSIPYIIIIIRMGQSPSGTLPCRGGQIPNKFQRRHDMITDVKGGHIEKGGYRLILMYISN